MSGSNPSQEAAAAKETPTGKKSLVLGGGCFWCVEAVFEALKGVDSVESGYAGGHTVNPTYRDVCSGETGHAEVVKVTYDPKVVSESDLLHIFFTTHDPTTMNRQGPDSGTQYRSVIFYADDAEKALAQSVIEEVTKEKIWSNPIVTTLEPLTAFYKAEDYHQDYFEKYEKASPAERMSMNAGYCSAIIDPKVRKFRAKYADKLKK
ncbi:MAG: peptide-methionine (S)-S-oxide reductase MsrA [Armatimonadetes bacterium]|nr:peptide-methionine (S)-S-oxide reductase MsrA [Armatimonadota bacterium]